MKIFLFAERDTTATTLIYAYYYLCANPSALAAPRTGHDAALGTDTSTAGGQIANNLALLNQLT
ncbi:hypothetical protein N7520_004261 [Penicillium odoratum]|uniref:uncharacterized protein n=1 Tax=Penicillium odoratum TaxID=1167516 RepID=UPI0025498D58|nr:uncharacterized protein N7520_004261 [Penicillium odoratum]KAJ5769702.1 hypothetical protein N7520_004261 [Penicillium odoratum]